MDKGLICIIIGLVCSITMIGVIIGIPLIILGTYWLTQKNKQEEKNIDKQIQIKQDQLNNIDNTLQEKDGK